MSSISLMDKKQSFLTCCFLPMASVQFGQKLVKIILMSNPAVLKIPKTQLETSL